MTKLLLTLIQELQALKLWSSKWTAIALPVQRLNIIFSKTIRPGRAYELAVNVLAER